MWICIAPCRDHTSKVLRYGMHSQKSHSFTCTPPPHFHTQQNEPYLPLPSQPKLVLIYRPRRDGRLSWPWVAGWLHTEIRVWHRELNPDTVAHLSTNWAWHWLTSLIEANHYARPTPWDGSPSRDVIWYALHVPTLVQSSFTDDILQLSLLCILSNLIMGLIDWARFNVPPNTL